jgi:hypothetical protein
LGFTLFLKIINAKIIYRDSNGSNSQVQSQQGTFFNKTISERSSDMGDFGSPLCFFLFATFVTFNVYVANFPKFLPCQHAAETGGMCG